MGFSYTVAAVIMLSSTLIFFGIVYTSYVQSNENLANANQKLVKNIYDLENTRVSIYDYYYNSSSSYFVINLTNNGSQVFNMSLANVLVNGSLVKFNVSGQFLFPLQTVSITFKEPAGSYAVEIVMPDGYEIFKKVVS
ncbi:flagellar protein F [Thermoplasma sp. Kam2015]|uniref:flagellar protein F n=1 Tax=Thermoplasma sp. Kam2015 TaxID=2094122 RepID=UPI001F3CF7E2|nr:flagellar protein F [Thermoplasma sp. Kam2015]